MLKRHVVYATKTLNNAISKSSCLVIYQSNTMRIHSEYYFVDILDPISGFYVRLIANAIKCDSNKLLSYKSQEMLFDCNVGMKNEQVYS